MSKALDYISRQLRALEILERLPDTGVEAEQLINRGMDVLSTSLNYISAHIRRESEHLGILGNYMQSEG